MKLEDIKVGIRVKIINKDLMSGSNKYYNKPLIITSLSRDGWAKFKELSGHHYAPSWLKLAGDEEMQKLKKRMLG